MSFLAEVMEHKAKELDTTGATAPRLSQARGNFLAGLQNPGVNIIAEVKPRSPSMKNAPANSLNALLASYNRHARAISVLTDEKFFGGSFQLLNQVSASSTLATLCKDFIVAEKQVVAARAAGAEAVLLIVRILDPATLETLFRTIATLGMTPLVEVQSFGELKLAHELAPPAILINNRNLATLAIDLKTTAELAPLVDKQCTVIAASGINDSSDIALLRPYVNNFLIGSAFMRSPDLELTFADLLHGGSR